MFTKISRLKFGKESTLLLLLMAIVVACSHHGEMVRTPTPAAPDVLTTDPELRDRLEKIAQIMEEQRLKDHIPGMALAVVKGDEIVFARGFGLADTEKKIPVHPGTVFAIGSSTKAFTSTLAGMMVEEGKMQWDDSVEKFLPYFKLRIDSDNEKEVVTVRDMLSHRSGFTRMGILWVSGKNTRETVLRTATKAKPYDGHRKAFHYTNIMYLASGMATGVAAGSDWDQLIAERLFTPLGMKDSSSSYAEAQAHPTLASGYRWDTEKQELRTLPMRNLDSAGPAGSINSNVLDMARWIRLQLGKGVFEGKRLIAEEQLLETRKPTIEVGGGAHYGLGWFLQNYKGQQLVFHGGNIDGYAAMVAFAPESDLGFVLLTNTTSSPLQNASIGFVFDQLLSDPKAPESSVAESGDQTDFGPYLGEYLADFGPFKNEYIKVLEQNGKLAVDVPRQTIYELRSENEEGKWVFSMTDTIAVSFEKNEAGTARLMRLHQNGFDFELPRKGFPIKPEIDESELRKFVGRYNAEEGNRSVNVVIKNHRLALEVNERLTVELHLPDDKGHRRIRVRPSNSVVFNMSENGEVESVSNYRDGEFRETLKRAVDTEMLAMADIEALRDLKQTKAALQSLGMLKMKGKIHFTNAGLSGEMSYVADGSKRYLLTWDAGSFGNSRTGVTPDYAATLSSHSPFEEHAGKYLEQMRKNHLGINYLDWNELFEKAAVLGKDKMEDKEVFRVRLAGGQTPSTVLFLDTQNGDVLKQESTLVHPLMGSVQVTTHYGDYRDIQGVRIPFEIKSSQRHIGELVYRFDQIETNLEVEPAAFIVKETAK